MCRARLFLQSISAALALLVVAPLASAEAFYGVGPSCKYHTIQAAIDALIANDHVFDPAMYLTTIVVAGNTTFPEALHIDSSSISWPSNPVPYQGAVVQIVGGYDQNCDQPDPSAPLGSTVIDAQGKSGSALYIHGSSYNYVVLSNLTLANANNTSGGATGGGINFTGSGSLDLTSVDIVNNQADEGGGIFADGVSPGAGITITMHTNTRLYDNFARHFAGGIHIEGLAHLVDVEAPTLIWNNTADLGASDSAGGGLFMCCGATADIGGSYGGLGVIDSNHAKKGGGVFVGNGSGLRLFSAVAGVPALIAENTAESLGGGLYVDAQSHVCASGYAFDNNEAGITNGILGEGSAIFVGDSGDVHLTETQLAVSDGNASIICGHGFPLPQRALCPIGIPCNEIDNNGTSTGDDSIFFVGQSANLVADRFEARGNHARYLAYSLGSLKLGDCLIAGNTIEFPLISNVGVAQINGCTLAGNALGTINIPLLSTGGAGSALTLSNSILALNTSAGTPSISLVSGVGTVQATDIIASEISSLPQVPGSNVNSLDPKFVDPAHGDYHLKPESPAADYHLSTNPGLFDTFGDLDGEGRGVQVLSNVKANGSAYDIGAYELQNLGDLIFVDGVEGFR